MKREDVKKLLGEGADDAIVDKIMAMNGQDIEKHKSLAETAKTDLDTIKGQLAEANTQIEDFKKLDVEGVKKAADEWKTKYDQAVEQHTNEAKQRVFDTALEKGLAAAKAKNALTVKPLLKLENLKYNEADGSLIGLEDQLKTLKADEKNGYLFEADENQEKTPEIVAPVNSNSTKTSLLETAMFKGAGLSETGK